jgi:5-methylcytosine-specific restriction enzyme subunit McrC
MQMPTGLDRNDLYQIHAYIDAFSVVNRTISGILVYPNEMGGRIGQHQAGNPWSTTVSGSSLSFYGISGEDESNHDLLHLTASEEQFCKELQSYIHT